MKRGTFLKLLNFWPPFIGAGIRVKKVSSDNTKIDVEMKLHFWNQNNFGSHFGGSLYAMCDAFFALILNDKLGKDYIVWDKYAAIHFKKPAYGNVYASFYISTEQIEAIRLDANMHAKTEPRFLVAVLDKEQNIIAQVEKIVYIKKKSHHSTKV